MCAPTSNQDSDLDSLSFAVGHFSRTTYYDFYTGMVIDWVADKVRLYVTDLTIGRMMIREAKQRDPDIDTSKIVLLRSPFGLKQFAAQMHRIWEDPKSDTYGVNTMSAAADGTHLVVTVTGVPGGASTANAAETETWLTGLGEIPVVIISEPPVRML